MLGENMFHELIFWHSCIDCLLIVVYDVALRSNMWKMISHFHHVLQR